MKFTLESAGDVNIVTAFEPGRIRIRDRDMSASLIVSATEIIADWPVSSSSELTVELLDSALSLEPEILLLGTGTRHTFPSPALHSHVLSRGVGFEVMDTAAACRTYNVLIQEQRRAVAALIVG